MLIENCLLQQVNCERLSVQLAEKQSQKRKLHVLAGCHSPVLCFKHRAEQIYLDNYKDNQE